MAHGHESGGHKKESAEHGGGKHGKWMEMAGKGLLAAGLTYGVAKFGPAILQAATVALAPHMLWIGLGAGFWYFFKQKSGDKKTAKVAHGHDSGHH